MMLNQTKFGHFLGSVEGINTKTLSIRLKNLKEWVGCKKGHRKKIVADRIQSDKKGEIA